MKVLISIPLISILLFSCQNNDESNFIHPLDQINIDKNKENKTPINIYQINWIEGVWIDSTSFPNTTVIENWIVKGDTIFGNRGTIKNGDTNYVQLSKIFIYNDEPVYLLEEEGSAFIVFKTKKFSTNSITFGNIANASPHTHLLSKERT